MSPRAHSFQLPVVCTSRGCPPLSVVARPAVTLWGAGVHAKIAGVRSEYWQEFSPLPFEVVLDAGRKAKEEPKDGDTPGALPVLNLTVVSL